MPNWVTHKLTLTGKPNTLRLFLERHLKPLDEQETDGSTASQQNGLQAGEGSTQPAEKSPSGADELGPEKSIPVYAVYPDGTVKEEIRTETGPVLDFETLLDVGDNDASDVWGTKWNASMGRIAGDPTKGSVTIWFDTPWSIPEPIFDAIAEKYPGLSAEGHAFDELWNFAATISIEGGVASVEQVDATVELYREVYGKEPESIPDRVSNEQEDDEGGAPLTVIVQSHLDDNDWGYEKKIDEDSNDCQFSMSVQIADQAYNVYIDVDEDDEHIGLFFYTPFNVPLDRVAEMAVLLNWINDSTRIGRLAVPLMETPGPVQWKASLDVEGSELSAKQVGTLILAGCNTFESYAEAIALVALTKATAEEAIGKWEEARKSGSKG